MSMTYSAGVVTAYGAAKAAGYSGTYEQFCAELADLAGISASASTLPAGSAATASYADGVISIGVPKGDKGDTGATGQTGPTGPEGPTGVGISSIAKTGTSGNVDTYTITLTNGSTAAFTVTNGNVSSVAGKTGAVTLDAGDVAYSGSDTYADGTVGAALGQLKSDITEFDTGKAPVIVSSASGPVASFPDGADGMPVRDLLIGIELVQSGSGDPAPDNVRPISGWTGAKVCRTGFNQWDEQWEQGIWSSTGSKTYSDSSFRSKNMFPVVPGAAYYMGMASRYTNGIAVRYFDANQSFISSVVVSQSNKIFTVPGNCFYMAFCTMALDGITSYADDICINFSGPDNGKYVPYAGGNDYSVSWQTAAGTVYGGSLDVTTGVLTVDRAGIAFNSIENPNIGASTTDTTGYRRWYIPASKFPGIKESADGNIADPVLKCSSYPTRSNNGTYHRYIGINLATDGKILIYDPDYCLADSTSAVGATNYLSQINPFFVYPLAEPVTYQLTPTEIDTLLGQNNIWADTGDTSVEYCADTKLYIERLTGPVETDMKADANIANGAYFMVGNSLYLSTAAIAAGEAIVPGTNCTATTLAAALNAINT